MNWSGRSAFRDVFEILDRSYGPQHWWPGDSSFEIQVGAILTQNTAWTNVERAIANLKVAALLSPGSILAASPAELAETIRPAGYYNVKAERLRHYCGWLVAKGGEHALRDWPTERLRTGLLSVKGIGPETADDILLYAFERPVFVIDAYTRRLFSRLGLLDARADYETLREHFETALGADVPVFNQYHALIVRHAKRACRKNPLCTRCDLRARCRRVAVP